MGKQINYYLHPDEDYILAEFLFKKNCGCIPRICANAKPEPVSPIICSELNSRIFLPEFIHLVHEYINTPNNKIWILTYDGIYIEWNRNVPNTSKYSNYDGVPIYSQSGRFYYRKNDIQKEVAECSRAMDKIYEAIARKVRNLSTNIGGYYIGNKLLEQARNGEVKLFYANQVSPIKLD